MDPVSLGLGDADGLALSPDAVFEFRENPEKLPQHRPHRRGGVDALPVAKDFDLAGVQLVQNVDEMPHRPAEPVRAPHHELVELALPGGQ